MAVWRYGTSTVQSRNPLRKRVRFTVYGKAMSPDFAAVTESRRVEVFETEVETEVDDDRDDDEGFGIRQPEKGETVGWTLKAASARPARGRTTICDDVGATRQRHNSADESREIVTCTPPNSCRPLPFE